ncbi:MAG: hypothetical protein DHS20C01_01040 [marine bacterium B5-7]|nr:MAG: hypothetical protein DHS20C01_01040 [marine bacterium B5-7]
MRLISMDSLGIIKYDFVIQSKVRMKIQERIFILPIRYLTMLCKIILALFQVTIITTMQK